MSGKSSLVHVYPMYAPHFFRSNQSFHGRLKGWMSVMVPPAASLFTPIPTSPISSQFIAALNVDIRQATNGMLL